MLAISYFKHSYLVPSGMLDYYREPEAHQSDDDEYVIARLIDRMRMTPKLGKRRIPISAEEAARIIMLIDCNISFMKRLGNIDGEGVSGLINNELVFTPEYMDQTGCAMNTGEISIAHLPTLGLIGFDRTKPDSIRVNGPTARDLVNLLCQETDFLVARAKSDVQLVSSGKLSWDQIEMMENWSYTDESLMDGCCRTGKYRPFAQWGFW
jgi:hypothetical protein